MKLDSLQRQVHALHLELPKYNLAVWTMGNVSARAPETGWVVIKPSGGRYQDLRPDNLVIVDLYGNVVEGDLAYSGDTRTHLYIYRHRPDVSGVCHTHSRFAATAFAAVGRPIPCLLTGMSGEFGGEIPLGGFALIGGEAIGREVLRVIGDSKAVVVQNHGVFTIGKTAEAAVKAAVMVEDAARTSFYALQLGAPIPIAPDDIAKLHDRYSNVYGQRA
ncbi:MAG: L-ribulose-5-phosphate 4-epimerase [Chloroflexi bacterium]|jgi:L-ribulose-5-phosphate 4-epimerase|uniref:L-ribulose-5-phosphate 4-epimerase n=1 Tax=Candidatus Thermofonsia Clade 3 bacterium TaxID=2364212 RepID=A0A2M8QG95_9CHLR|nr:L-ribulose-5-phosphate 4-epimerase [Candidatus Roseilinea sp. NK_OTU-006]PJF48772.1 MAG: L-ribulose-5-phosphate 4-epimerase [Candidatus Thermofonsia Clade 3 bacterium]RMG63603.1 MAG: L-ribulose-5-phosphate 4-epimerase [Chloroflexota bacterium]